MQPGAVCARGEEKGDTKSALGRQEKTLVSAFRHDRTLLESRFYGRFRSQRWNARIHHRALAFVRQQLIQLMEQLRQPPRIGLLNRQFA